MAGEEIVLVNENDEYAGCMEKMLAHRTGALHRAFSVVLLDGEGSMLIQQRGRNKYHSPLLWANACCSHQREGETLDDAVHRGMAEELGISGVHVTEAFTLRYRCAFSNGLVENEIDHVFSGFFPQGPIRFNREEIEQVVWMRLDQLKSDIRNRGDYAYWFRRIVERLAEMPGR